MGVALDKTGALLVTDDVGNTGLKTGFWLDEFAAPYYVFLDAGAHLTLASPLGGQPPIDPKSAAEAARTDATARLNADATALIEAMIAAVPFLVQDMLTTAGGKYTQAPVWQPHVVTDGLLITGQNPASSLGAAKALVQRLQRQRSACSASALSSRSGPRGRPEPHPARRPRARRSPHRLA